MVAVDDNVVILILFFAVLVSIPVLYTFFTSYVDKSAKEAKEEAKERERDLTQRMTRENDLLREDIKLLNAEIKKLFESLKNEKVAVATERLNSEREARAERDRRLEGF